MAMVFGRLDCTVAYAAELPCVLNSLLACLRGENPCVRSAAASALSAVPGSLHAELAAACAHTCLLQGYNYSVFDSPVMQAANKLRTERYHICQSWRDQLQRTSYSLFIAQS